MVHYSSESIFDEQAAQATEIGEWLEDHHASVEAENGEEYHIFAVTGAPSFGGLGQPRPKYKVDIHVPIRPVVFIFHGFIDLRTYESDINVFVKLPLLRPIKIGHIAGDLHNEIKITFKIPHVSGTIGLLVLGGYLHIHFNVNVFGRHVIADLHKVLLLPLHSPVEAGEGKGEAVANGTAIAAAA